MAWFGWITAFIIGGYFVTAGAFTLALLWIQGGLEAVVPAFVLAIIAGAAWCALFLWLSPVSVSLQ